MKGRCLKHFWVQIKLYYNPKVQNSYIFFYQDADLETKTRKGSGRKVVPNSAFQLIFSLILRIPHVKKIGE